MAEIGPLVLDVDGTFLKTDLLFESFWAALGKRPIATLGVVARNIRRPAEMKRELAKLADLRLDLMPVNPDIAQLAVEGVGAGREVVLASASDKQYVAGLAETYGLSGRVFASDGETNLKGPAKATQLVAEFGDRGFDYAGDSAVDRVVWEHSENALIVGDRPAEAKALTESGHSVTQFAAGWRKRDLIRALRPHQWVKNILLFLPMIAAHSFDMETLLLVVLGIAAFSAAASSIYVVNDLLDLEADRLHPTKCNRPFASGVVPIRVGMVTFLALVVISFGLGTALGPLFLGVLVLYMLLSLSYSLKLKRMRWVDIATLAGLYTLRVIAGAAASQVEASAFMLVFIFPVFITLGCVKRMTELTLATSDERLPGRGYGRPDRGDLLNVSGLGMFFALLVFFFYSFSDQARALYPDQWIMWLALIPIAAWLFRMIRLGYYGKQDYDPIVFAMKDKRGLGLLLFTLSMMFYAAGYWQEWFGF